MNSKQQILYLIDHFIKGSYMTADYTSIMSKIYNIENDGSLNDEEEKIIAPLVLYAEYYSPYESDYQSSIGRKIYKNDADILSKSKEIYIKLLNYYSVKSLETLYMP